MIYIYKNIVWQGKELPHPITMYLRKGVLGNNLRAMCTTSLHREQSSARRSISEVRFRDVANTGTLSKISARVVGPSWARPKVESIPKVSE